MAAFYLAAGANRHPSVADWDENGVLAFGCDRNIALWRPKVRQSCSSRKSSIAVHVLTVTQNTEFKGVHDLVSGHTDTVNAVKFLPGATFISGSVDKTIKIWKKDAAGKYTCVQTLSDHGSSVNCIAVADGVRIFASGSADAGMI